MSENEPLPELRLGDDLAKTVRDLRSVLLSHGYTDDGVRTSLGTPAGSENTERVQDLWEATDERRQSRTAFSCAADALVHLFLLEGTLAMSLCRTLLGPRAATGLLDAGILKSHGQWVSAEALLVPWRGFWLLTDTYACRRARDAVFVPDASSYALAALLPVERGTRAMDLGTGSGILALAQADLFEQVIAVDVNLRSVAFARFNAAVNDRRVVVERCEADPLGQTASPLTKADLITFVMPFVHTEADDAESTALVSRDGAGLLEGTYRGVDATLADRGTALLWHQVPIHPPGSFERALERWGVVPRNHVLLNLAAMSDRLELGVAAIRRGARRGVPPIGRLDRDTTGRMRWAGLESAFSRMSCGPRGTSSAAADRCRETVGV